MNGTVSYQTVHKITLFYLTVTAQTKKKNMVNQNVVKNFFYNSSGITILLILERTPTSTIDLQNESQKPQ